MRKETATKPLDMDYTLQEPAPKKKAKPRTQASRRRQNVPFKPDELMKELSAASKTASAKSADENGRGTKYPNVQSYYNAQKSPQRTNTRRQAAKPRSSAKKIPIRIIPLGGLNEIGKNMTLYECQNDMFIVDCGLAFPDADMLGVDLVIPDFTFIEDNIKKIKGIVITHGHEDHIGAIPYLLKRFDLPIYASPLAIGLIKGKLKEHGLLSSAKLFVVSPRQTVQMGCMKVEFIHVNHSIPDAMGIVVHSPAGIIIQTGDFKIDYTPIEGGMMDLARLAELGEKGVLCLLSDSTNAERPGATPSERKVGRSFEGLFNRAEGRRIIIASFSSNIHRIQQILSVAERYGRKVAV